MLLETVLAISLALFMGGGWLLWWGRVGWFASLRHYRVFLGITGVLLAQVLGWLGFYLITGQRPPPPRVPRPVAADVSLGALVLLAGLGFLGRAWWLAWRNRRFPPR